MSFDRRTPQTLFYFCCLLLYYFFFFLNIFCEYNTQHRFICMQTILFFLYNIGNATKEKKIEEMAQAHNHSSELPIEYCRSYSSYWVWFFLLRFWFFFYGLSMLLCTGCWTWQFSMESTESSKCKLEILLWRYVWLNRSAYFRNKFLSVFFFISSVYLLLLFFCSIELNGLEWFFAVILSNMWLTAGYFISFWIKLRR